MNHSEIVSFLWGVADLIRDSFKRGKYQDVILPLTVLRRLDCVLGPTKESVLQRQARLRARGLEDLHRQLCMASGFAFYNTSLYDFDKLLADAPGLAGNLRNYIAGFSPNMREVLERFDFDNTISKLDEAGLLFQVLERFRTVDLHPEKVDNPTMGTIFEELIRKFNEALDENPGEHFTPRDVVHLMVDLMLAGDEARIAGPGVVRTVYDPCCGSGGMLMITKEHITEGLLRSGDRLRPAINAQADIYLFGQEVNPETWAVSKSDFFMKDPTGRDADNVAFGSTLSNDRHAAQSFDYLIANPPYGKDWKRDKDTVTEEHERGATGRFGPGLPRISDGQTLFLLHMLMRAKAPDQGGARIAIIMNGSPLFTGDAGSGESEIRRFILENDLLEALIALPEQLFYNTGIATYVWLLTNRKAPERRGWCSSSTRPRSGRRCGGASATSDARYRRRRRRTCWSCSPLAGTGHAHGRQGWQGRGTSRQPRLPHHPLRLPQNHRRAAAPAELPGERGTHCPPPRAEGLPESGQVEEAGRGRRQGGSRGARTAAGRSGPSGTDARQTAQGPGSIRRGGDDSGRKCRRQTPRAGAQRDPCRPLRARRDGRDLSGQGRHARTGPGASRHRACPASRR